jgi:hypothetical protein
MGHSLTFTLHDGGARPLPSHWRRLIETLPPDVRDSYEERAALIEYDGGEPRKTAERRAFECVVWQGGNGADLEIAGLSRESDLRGDAKLMAIR